MLITKEVEVNLTGRMAIYYENLGYDVLRQKDKYGRLKVPVGTRISVKIEDLPSKSAVIVEYLCDYCLDQDIETVVSTPYYNYNNKTSEKDCCKNCKYSVAAQTKIKNNIKNNTDEKIKNDFIYLSNKLGRCPTSKDIETERKINKKFISNGIIRKYFKSIYLLAKACDIEAANYSGYTKEDLIGEIQRFVIEYKRIPTSIDFDNLDGYPTRKTFTNHFEDFNMAIREAGFEPTTLSQKEFDETYRNKEYLSSIIFNYQQVYNKVPTLHELMQVENNQGLNLLYRQVYGSWNNALQELGLPLNSISQYNDKFLEEEFHRFVRENGRVPIYAEFNNSAYPSFWCYQNRFGSWNNAVQSYGYNIQSDLYNFDVIKSQLLDLCNKIKIAENRNIISVADIEDCKDIASYSCIAKHFKKNGYTVKSLLNEHGFDMCNEGCGLNHLFADGETTKSRYELLFSNYLKNELNLIYNVDYQRDVKYKTFIENYNGNMNCDYVIHQKHRTVYLEIAGILNGHESNFNNGIPISSSKFKEKYRISLAKKEQMLRQSNLEYYILFPRDLNNEYFECLLI